MNHDDTIVTAAAINHRPRRTRGNCRESHHKKMKAMPMPMPTLRALIVAPLLALASINAASAFQLGQLSSQSYLGESLSARIELYGFAPAATDAIAFSLKPAITARAGDAADTAVEALTVNLVTAEGMAPYVRVSSTTPLNEPALEFRLRMTVGKETLIKHYTLALPPRQYITQRPARRSQSNPRQTQSATVDLTADGQRYGPVRPGQTLWRILRERGLTGGDTGALIAHIVARNPHAFRGGNADRLQVGVMLDLPTTTVSTVNSDIERSAATATASADTLATPVEVTTESAATSPIQAPASTVDEETAARLAALTEKFAAIKARYAAQQATDAAAPDTHTTTNEPSTETRDSAPPAEPIVSVDKTTVAQAIEVESAPEAQTPAPVASSGRSIWTMLIGGVIALAAMAALGRSAMVLAQRWRVQRETHRHRAGDEAMVAEIARKAEQRLKLEDEVKRRISENRSAAVPEPVTESANSIERSIERADSAVDSTIDEIEHRIAHGQYAEAEKMLHNVIRETPRNARAKLRLLEILYLGERADEFVALASDLAANHRPDIGDEGWQRVMRMGKVLTPERPPFSGPVGVRNQA